MTINQIANAISIFCERVGNILHNGLVMTKVSARWEPRLLTPNQKRTRLRTLQADLTLFDADPAAGFFESRTSVVFRDKKTIYAVETLLPLAPKANVVLSAGKIIVSVFWDA